MISTRRLAPAVLALLLAVAPAQAAVVVYHSDTGKKPKSRLPLQLTGGPAEQIQLYASGGNVASATGTVCTDGDGQEWCALDVTIEVAEGHIVGFAAEPGVVFFPTSLASQPTQIRINVIRAVPPPTTTSPFFLGTLTVDASSGSARVTVREGESVGAAKQLEQIPQDTIAIPEPGEYPLLGSGLAGLALLRWIASGRLRRAAQRR